MPNRLIDTEAVVSALFASAALIRAYGIPLPPSILAGKFERYAEPV
jgi:hypothetical protein